jgi:hypothetical protein
LEFAGNRRSTKTEGFTVVSDDGGQVREKRGRTTAANLGSKFGFPPQGDTAMLNEQVVRLSRR